MVNRRKVSTLMETRVPQANSRVPQANSVLNFELIGSSPPKTSSPGSHLWHF